VTESHTLVPCLSIRLPAVASSVPAARRRARSFAASNGVTGTTLSAVALAVTEAVTNAVRHAYPVTRGDVQVMLDVEDGVLEVVVTDEGLGFTNRPVTGLGLGLMLMREISDAFEVRDVPVGGVEVWMRFALAG
jgi:serine/threonine-protein kinase RsbW